MSDDPTYTFKEFWQDRFDRFERMLIDDLKEIKADVKSLQVGQDTNGREIENMKGKMIVYGSLSIIVGTAIASLVVKLVGS